MLLPEWNSCDKLGIKKSHFGNCILHKAYTNKNINPLLFYCVYARAWSGRYSKHIAAVWMEMATATDENAALNEKKRRLQTGRGDIKTIECFRCMIYRWSWARTYECASNSKCMVPFVARAFVIVRYLSHHVWILRGVFFFGHSHRIKSGHFLQLLLWIFARLHLLHIFYNVFFFVWSFVQ